jgi:hypothetical protein
MKPTQATTTMKMKYLNGQKESYTLTARKKFMKKKMMYVSEYTNLMNNVVRNQLCAFLLIMGTLNSAHVTPIIIVLSNRLVLLALSNE